MAGFHQQRHIKDDTGGTGAFGNQGLSGGLAGHQGMDDGFEPKLIRTVRGMGYVLEIPECG